MLSTGPRTDRRPHRDELSARRKPQQKRSLGREQAILAATWAILGESGIAGLTTQRVAERASVPIGSVYYLFPNKHALLARFMELCTRRLNDISGRILGDADKPWQESVGRLVDELAEEWWNDRAFAALWEELKHEPELRRLDDECNAAIEATNALFLKRICPGMPGIDVEVTSRLMVHVIDRILHESNRQPTPRKRRLMVEHLKLMLVSYIDSATRSRKNEVAEK